MKIGLERIWEEGQAAENLGLTGGNQYCRQFVGGR